MKSRFAIRWIDDCRTRRTALLLGIIWVLGLCDLYFTMWAFRFTVFSEMNPWASRLLRNHQLASMGLTKLLLVGGSSVIFWSVRKHRVTEIALWGLMLAHVGLIFRWSIYTNDALEMWAYCPSAPSVLMNEPVSTTVHLRLEMAHAHALAMLAASHEVQPPRVPSVPAALFFENNPQNWPKPRT